MPYNKTLKVWKGLIHSKQVSTLFLTQTCSSQGHVYGRGRTLSQCKHVRAAAAPTEWLFYINTVN